MGGTETLRVAQAGAAASSPSVGRAVVAAPRRLDRPSFDARHDGLTAPQRRVMVGAIVGAHALAGWGLLQVREVRQAIADAAPMFVSLVTPEAPKPPAEPPPPPRQPPPRRAPPRLFAATPAPAPAPTPALVAPPPPVEAPPPAQAIETPPPPPPPTPAPAPAPAPAAAPPKVIPASAVQYLEPIALEYPRVSRRLGETGKVLIRVWIDEAGLAKKVQVDRGSGHPRLDDAALAAVQKARFRPYTENGQPVAGWAFIPLEFELEK